MLERPAGRGMNLKFPELPLKNHWVGRPVLVEVSSGFQAAGGGMGCISSCRPAGYGAYTLCIPSTQKPSQGLGSRRRSRTPSTAPPLGMFRDALACAATAFCTPKSSSQPLQHAIPTGPRGAHSSCRTTVMGVAVGWR